MLKLNLAKRGGKFLKNLPPKQAKQIAQKIMALREDPLPKDSKKLVGSPYLRADIGEYRIVYFVEKDVLHVVLVGKRNDGKVYKELNRIS